MDLLIDLSHMKGLTEGGACVLLIHSVDVRHVLVVPGLCPIIKYKLGEVTLCQIIKYELGELTLSQIIKKKSPGIKNLSYPYLSSLYVESDH